MFYAQKSNGEEVKSISQSLNDMKKLKNLILKQCK